MWCQAPVDSRAPDEITCSAALPVALMAKRTELGVACAWKVVRNMYPVVLELLKSNTRAHARSVVMLTQQAMVIAVVAPIAFRLAGMLTYAPFVLLVPARLTAPVPTMCVAEKVAVPVPTFVSVPLRALPAQVVLQVPPVPQV